MPALVAVPAAVMPELPPELPPVLATSVAGLYREVWRHAAGARVQLVAALSLLGGSQLLKLALPWLAAQAINALQAGGPQAARRALGWVAAIGALNLGVWLLHGPARVLERGVALRVRRSVSDLLYARLVAAPLTWHDRHHSGDLLHRVGQASAALSGFTESQFIYLQNAVQLVGPLAALWLLSGTTGALAVLGFVAIAAVSLRFDRALMVLAAQETAADRRYSARLLDFVANISAVASLRLQRATRALLEQRLLAVFEPLRRSIVLTEWKWGAVDLLSIALVWALVAAYAGGLLAAGQALLIGSLFMVQQYAQQAAGVLVAMAAHYQGLAHTQAHHASADPIMRAPQQAAPQPLPADWQTLTWHGLHFSHEAPGLVADAAATRSASGASLSASGAGQGRRGGLHGIELVLRRGERVALVGASGSGKSTLLRVLAGLYPAQSGQLAVDGVVQPGVRDAAALAVLVAQEAEVFETTLRENLCLGDASIGDAELTRALQASALDEVLAGLPQGLESPMSERGMNLSGGQRQRLALARGLLAARQASLLLLDEPTSALDPVIEQHVQQGITHAFGHACIVASVHRLSLLPHFDRVLFMADGQIVDGAPLAELGALQARQPAFAALCAGAGLVPAPVAEN